MIGFRRLAFVGGMFVSATLVCSFNNAVAERATGNECPYSRVCVIYCPDPVLLNENFGEAYTDNSVSGENYAVYAYLNRTLNDAPLATLNELTSICGIRFYSSHGCTDRFEVEVYATAAARNQAFLNYSRQGWDNATEIARTDESYLHYIWITDNGIQGHLRNFDNAYHTVTFGAACYSSFLQGSFGGREFFGYDCVTFALQTSHDSAVLWDYMTGIMNQGNSRPAGEAFAAGLDYEENDAFKFTKGHGGCFPGRLRHYSSAGGKTTLSPVVADHSPYPAVEEGERGYVFFDTKMDVTYDCEVVEVDSGASLSDFSWNANQDCLTFTVHNIQNALPYTFTVHWQLARDDYQKNHLNGNVEPTLSDGIRPNKDPFVWTAYGDAFSADPSFIQHDRRNPTAVSRAREALVRAKENRAGKAADKEIGARIAVEVK